jgi:hypothetical protein
MSFKRLLFLVKIDGLSCWPYLMPGRKYLATSVLAPKVGDFVVFRAKDEDRFLVKKVMAKEEKGYRVASTLLFSQENDNLGLIPSENIEGRVLFPS